MTKLSQLPVYSAQSGDTVLALRGTSDIMVTASSVAALQNFIPATNLPFATLVANYPAANYKGYVAVTSDQGVAISNGTLWYVTADQQNVLSSGADPTGATDSTAAFSAAVASAGSGTPYTGSTVAIAPSTVVYVPPGTYSLTSEVTINGVNVTWILADGATITPSTNYTYLNGRVVRPGKQDNQYTYGIFYNACGFSSRANVPIDSPPAVMGFLTPSAISAYPTCDSVAIFGDNTAPPPLSTIAATGTTYTSTTIAFTTALTATVLKQMRVGMIIQTLHSTFYSGFVTGWTSNSITVSAWYQQGNSGAGQVPANGFGAYVSPVTKIFAFNGNVTLTTAGGAIAQQATGFEIGVLNNYSAPSGFIGTLPKLWAYDAVNLGTYACETAFNARNNNVGFFAPFQVSGVNNAGTTVYGYFDQTIYGTTVTANGVGFIHAPATQSAAAVATVVGFQASDVSLGGGGSSVNLHVGFLASALASATANRAFVGQVASGATNYNCYMSGTAANLFGGLINLTSAAAAASVSSGIALGGTTQTTVGSTGAASALPANPLGYLIAYAGSTKIAIPYYNG